MHFSITRENIWRDVRCVTLLCHMNLIQTATRATSLALRELQKLSQFTRVGNQTTKLGAINLPAPHRHENHLNLKRIVAIMKSKTITRFAIISLLVLMVTLSFGQDRPTLSLMPEASKSGYFHAISGRLPIGNVIVTGGAERNDVIEAASLRVSKRLFARGKYGINGSVAGSTFGDGFGGSIGLAGSYQANGTFALDAGIDWYPVSPKFSDPSKQAIEWASQLRDLRLQFERPENERPKTFDVNFLLKVKPGRTTALEIRATYSVHKSGTQNVSAFQKMEDGTERRADLVGIAGVPGDAPKYQLSANLTLGKFGANADIEGVKPSISGTFGLQSSYIQTAGSNDDTVVRAVATLNLPKLF